MIFLLKGKASQALTDLIVFSFRWILSSFFWINPASFSPTLVSVPSHRGACIAFFLCLHYREHVAWIRVHCSYSEPKSSLVSILDYISVCVETDWAGCVLLHTHNHKMMFGLNPLCPPEYRQGYGMETALLKVQIDMLLIINMHPESTCSFSSTDKILLE